MLTRYGLKELFLALVVCGGAAAALIVWVTPWAAIAPGVPLLFTLYFFRDPRRTPPEGERLIVSPADGKVVDIEDVDEPEVIGGRAVRVGIFLSILDVHLNQDITIPAMIPTVLLYPSPHIRSFYDFTLII